MNNKYTQEIKRAIANYYYTMGSTTPMPVYTAMKAAIDRGETVLVPKNEDKYSEHIENEAGDYYIPVYTEEGELEDFEKPYAMCVGLSEIIDASGHDSRCLGIVINPWGARMSLGHEALDYVMKLRADSVIAIAKGSVIDMNVGAIVNAASGSLLGGGGVDGAIHAAAGWELLEECRALHGCRTGEAKITGAYEITNAERIIHTVGPIYSREERDAELLASCYKNSLDLALRNGLYSVAFPCISTGIFGYPLKDATEIAYAAVRAWISDHADTTMIVYFACYRDDEFDAYSEILDN